MLRLLRSAPDRLLASLALVLALSPSSALASTGVCDSNPPTSSDACIAAIQSAGAGAVVNDIFKDANGLSGPQLPLFGKLFNHKPACAAMTTSFAGCAGVDTGAMDCPGLYTCTSGVPNDFANASAYLDALDHQWWHPCRRTNHTVTNGCSDDSLANCIADGVGGAYFPWEGLVFDLGGPSNKVAIFASNDHGPQPCESVEYTVFLTDNPYAQEIVLDPKTTGIDPTKWNRAVLKQIFTKGWVEVRPPDPAGHLACGDTALYSVEDDSFVTVYSLPCGVTFRYTAIVAGNDGLDFPECGFDSNEAELDAVAGLTEGGAAVCPDADKDQYVDCSCTGAPPVCDCNDADPAIHPGAPESCDAADVNCDGQPSPCANPYTCYQGLCLSSCPGPEFPCPAGASCTSTPQGSLCVPSDCTVGGCPPGGVCKNGVCLPACTGVVCPGKQQCEDGVCKDPCAGVVCPAGELCESGKCQVPCSCFAGDIGCANQPGTVCDPSAAGACVPPACAGVTCAPPEACDPTTGLCAPFCNPNVVCPDGQKCVDPNGCVPLCEGVQCNAGFACDPKTGSCVDKCLGVGCLAPLVCVDGECVDTSGSTGASTTGSGESSSSASTGSSMGGQGGGAGHVIESAGCGCRTSSGGERDTGALALALALLGGVIARRRGVRRSS